MNKLSCSTLNVNSPSILDALAPEALAPVVLLVAAAISVVVVVLLALGPEALAVIGAVTAGSSFGGSGIFTKERSISTP